MQFTAACPILATFQSDRIYGASDVRHASSYAGVDMASENKIANVGRYLTSEETVELARIQRDASVIGYAVLALDGTEVEAGGTWSSMLAPVFSNVFDLADRMGSELGEQEPCSMMFFESPDFEIAALMLTSARAIIIKRKQKRLKEGLRSVS